MRLAKDMGTSARPFFEKLLARMTDVWDTAAAVDLLNKVRHLAVYDWTEDENIEAILSLLTGQPFRPYFESGVVELLQTEYGISCTDAVRLLEDNDAFVSANKGEQLYVVAHLAWLFEKQRRSQPATCRDREAQLQG
jgi:hypothetical protein